MKNLHFILWALLIIVFAVLAGQNFYITHHHESLPIFSLETASANEGKAILDTLAKKNIEGVSLLHFAQVNTWLDFFFIIGYVGAIIMISYSLMQKEKQPFINNFLRFDILLALIIGLLDVVENIILLNDMHDYKIDKQYISSMHVSDPKWILVIIVLVSWLVSLLNRAFKRS
ncbi:MAG TPA: hypothetical protein VKT28_19380 [Puia sp.]|nr:hypothetical protein [Puia sp.]